MPDARPAPASWLIREEGWEPKRQDHFATVLALGNGRIGCRSVLDEAPAGSTPGTFLAGVFDAAGSIVDDLVNLPNPLELNAFINGQRVSVDVLRVLAHHRTLDMRHGVLTRRTVFQGGRGGRFELRSERFVVRGDSGSVVVRAWLTALDGDATILVSGDFGLGAVNTEGDWEGAKRHFAVEAIRRGPAGSYCETRMLESGTRVGCGWTTLVGTGRGKPIGAEPVTLTLHRGRPILITRIANLQSSLDVPAAALQRLVQRDLGAAVRRGAAPLLRDHRRAWEDLWSVSAVAIPGARRIEQASLFSIYHLLICGTPHGTPAGIGAKSLSGEGYRGHSFWDTEIYTLPFYAYNHPGMARQLVRYRLNRLPVALANARARGFKGALYPWESGRTGAEVTPWFPKGDGRLYLFETGKYQHHITGDVAAGLLTYLTVTGDAAVLAQGGLDLFVETARFWASRVTWNAKRGTYEINGVIGPDEYHVNVNNNAYTNLLAQWNLTTAAEQVAACRRARPREAKRLRLQSGEPDEWRRIAGLIQGTQPAGPTGIVEQFDGFFQRRDVPITRRTKHGMPDWQKGVTEDTVGRTQLSKQADVVLAMLMFPDRFPLARKIANFRYYEPRTLHMSSLSASAYARAGLEWGVGNFALRYFTTSLFMDLNDVQGNTEKGMHIACCGGNWQTLVCGFGGVTVRDGGLVVAPRVPKAWRTLSYGIVWRGARLAITAGPKAVTVRNRGPKPAALTLGGRQIVAAPGATVRAVIPAR